AVEHVAGEGLGLDGRELVRERLEDDHVRAGLAEQLGPPFEGRDEGRSQRRREQPGGVRIERQGDGLAPVRGGQTLSRREQGLMPPVYAVEVADRDGWPTELAPERGGDGSSTPNPIHGAQS